MTHEQYWNGLSTIKRLELIKAIERKTVKKFGESNSKCTFSKISNSLAISIMENVVLDSDSLKTIIPVKTTSKKEKSKDESMQLLLSFDDTGSMRSVRKLVRQKINELTDTLFATIPNLEISIMIHNDYCDHPDHIYIQDFTSDKKIIEKFVNRNSPCGGGDNDELYELVLHEATKLNWKSQNRAMILIGDAEPHRVGYRYGSITNHFDWKTECRTLSEMGIKIYSVQALCDRNATYFYEGIASMTNGTKLELTQFDHIETYIKAIAYKQNGNFDDFESSEPQFKTNIALKNMFRKLRGLVEEMGISDKLEFMSKFQVMKVDRETVIKDFVEMNGCEFERGKGFYQLIERTADGKANSEIIQADKKVILVDKKTGEVIEDTIFNRKKLGIPYGTKGTCRPLQIPDVMNNYEIFIQSNSYNRKLDGGCKFLYEALYR